LRAPRFRNPIWRDFSQRLNQAIFAAEPVESALRSAFALALRSILRDSFSKGEAQVDIRLMSVRMSDMDKATFTVRDLNRQPRKVLQACDRFGSVYIRTRNGKIYSLALQGTEAMGPLPDFAARRQKLRELGLRPLTREQQRRFDKWLAGEG
jgi:hypothetical protein